MHRDKQEDEAIFGVEQGLIGAVLCADWEQEVEVSCTYQRREEESGSALVEREQKNM